MEHGPAYEHGGVWKYTASLLPTTTKVLWRATTFFIIAAAETNEFLSRATPGAVVGVQVHGCTHTALQGSTTTTVVVVVVFIFIAEN